MLWRFLTAFPGFSCLNFWLVHFLDDVILFHGKFNRTIIITMAIIILFTIVGTMEFLCSTKSNPFYLLLTWLFEKSVWRSSNPVDQIRNSILILFGHIIVAFPEHFTSVLLIKRIFSHEKSIVFLFDCFLIHSTGFSQDPRTLIVKGEMANSGR